MSPPASPSGNGQLASQVVRVQHEPRTQAETAAAALAAAQVVEQTVVTVQNDLRAQGWLLSHACGDGFGDGRAAANAFDSTPPSFSCPATVNFASTYPQASQAAHLRRHKMTTVSPFARSSVFDEPRLGGREQTVRTLAPAIAGDEPYQHPQDPV